MRAEQGRGWRNDEYTVGESWCTGSDVVLVKWAVSKAVVVVVVLEAPSRTGSYRKANRRRGLMDVAHV
jgi:hypothetical protein